MCAFTRVKQESWPAQKIDLSTAFRQMFWVIIYEWCICFQCPVWSSVSNKSDGKMYGLLLESVQFYVIRDCGEQVWKAILEHAGTCFTPTLVTCTVAGFVVTYLAVTLSFSVFQILFLLFHGWKTYICDVLKISKKNHYPVTYLFCSSVLPKHTYFLLGQLTWDFVEQSLVPNCWLRVAIYNYTTEFCTYIYAGSQQLKC